MRHSGVPGHDGKTNPAQTLPFPPLFPEGGGSTEISVEKHPAGRAPRRLGLQDRLFILVTADWAGFRKEPDCIRL